MIENEISKYIRSVVDTCTDCDTCRYLMAESCLLFTELYRLYDQKKDQGIPIKNIDLKKLVELCTLCGLCPCPNIQADIIQGKTEIVRKDGMTLGNRLLADVQSFGQLSSLAPNVLNSVLSFKSFRNIIKKILGVHPLRNFPKVAEETFFEWASKKGLNRDVEQTPKVAYFAGCTAGYLFPEVARAAVKILIQNNVSVHVPQQKCCGMPTLLEGNESITLNRVRSNLKTLLTAVSSGYDLVCSCPTCGYLMKVLLRENAYYSKAYQRSIDAGVGEMRIPHRKAGKESFFSLKKSIYAKILTDEGYFSSIDPLDRIHLSEKLMDIGQYLYHLHQEKHLNTDLGKLEGRMVYFAPCHQREQESVSSYEKLLALIPGMTIEPVGGALDCCGMGGNLGFKKSFYEASVKLGMPLMEKIKAAEPDAIITDCLSCRLQFLHILSFPVFHPLEILSRSYDNFLDEKKRTETWKNVY